MRTPSARRQDTLTTTTLPEGQRPLRSRWQKLALIGFCASFLYGCSGGLSCGAEAGAGCVNAYDYPQSTIPNGAASVDDAARIRMTQAALDFLSQNLREILLAQFGSADPNNPDLIAVDVGTFDLVDGSGLTLSLGQGENETHPVRLLLSAEDMADRLTFEFVEGAQDGIRVRMEDIPVGLDARFYTIVDFLDFGFGPPTAACNIESTNPAYGPGIITGLTVDAIIRPDVGTGSDCNTGEGECLLINVSINEVDLDPQNSLGASSLDISSAPRCNVSNPPANCSQECSDTVIIVDNDGDRECQAFCPIYDFAGDIVLELFSAVETLLAPFMDNLMQLAIRNALEDFNGAPLSLSSRFPLQDLAPGVVGSTTHDLGFSISPTGNAFDVNCPAGQACLESRGMDFVLKTGFEAAPPLEGDTEVPHPCVAPLQGADFANFYTGQGEFIAPDTEPLTGIYDEQVYHLGMSMARSGLNQAMFAAYNTGVMCLELSSDNVHQLTGGAFPLSAGTIDLLAEGKLRQYTDPNSPALVALVPGEPPKLSFGEGTEEEGHIRLEWNNLEVSFYVLMYERYTRVFSVATDISAGITVFNDPEDSMLKVSIVEGPTVENFDERYNELLPGVAFDTVLESLITLMFDAVLSQGLEFEYDIGNGLSDALGVPIFIDFRGIETVEHNGEGEYINAYLAMSYTEPQPRMAAPKPTLRLADEPGLFTRLERPETPTGEITYPTGEVHLTGDFVRLADDLEVFVKVDGGGWRGPIDVNGDGEFVVKDGKLRFIGQHHILYRARHKGDYNSLAPVAQEVSVWVDPIAPKVELVVAGDSVVALGSDYGTQEEDLQWAFASNHGTFSAFSYDSIMPLSAFGDAREISVIAKDLAGNVSRPVTLDLGTKVAQDQGAASLTSTRDDVLEANTVDVALVDSGCDQTAASASWLWLGLLSLLRRRRR